MIATMKDCYCPNLPIEVIRAQARVSKLISEMGLPPRLLNLCIYLVTTTSLERSGRVFLSRKKVAPIVDLSERTLDRYFDELEGNGILSRQVRDRTPDGWFYGTCVRWSESIWDLLFVKPGRTRKQAVAQLRAARGALAAIKCEGESAPDFPSQAPNVSLKSIEGEVIAKVSIPTQPEIETLAENSSPESTRPALQTDFPVAIHAPKMSHYSLPPITTVFKELTLSKVKPTKMAFQKHTFAKHLQTVRPAFNIPPSILPWAQQLQLQPENISLLMCTAKRTDPQRTQTRLQDLLNYVGDRLLRCSILGASASKYLYKCLNSGEDYSQARFNAPDAPGRDNAEAAAARALRGKLPQGVVTVISGAHLLRHDNVVQRVDPTYGDNGECHMLTLAQQAVLAKRAGLVDVSNVGYALVNSLTTTVTAPQVAAPQHESIAPTYKDLRTAEVRKEFLALPADAKKVFLAPALSHLKGKGLANASLTLKVEAGEWHTAPILLSTMVTQYACEQYGSDWFVKPT